MSERDHSESLPYEVLVEVIGEQLRALTRLAQAYMDVPRNDTSPEERRKLAEVADLLSRALDRFQ